MGVGVSVHSLRPSGRLRLARALLPAALVQAALLASAPAAAGTLPDDRADVLFHSYDGGGVTVQGPSVLVRKKFAGKFSASAKYYQDRVSSASIDVVTTASPYTEHRTEKSLGLDYLHDGWQMNMQLTNSVESDYVANTFSFGVSQDIFGDLTTVSLGYSVGHNHVGRRGDPSFSAKMQSQDYRLGLSQILTKNLLLGLSFEAITDQGFLNNPYRSVRYADSGSPLGYSFEPEVYPHTHSSDAAAIRLRYYLPYRAAIHGAYRAYSDTWDVGAQTYELGYTHPLASGWIIEGSLRWYSQTKASFYSDLFPRADFQNFMARDKELSTFTSKTISVGVTYNIMRGGWKFIDRGTLNLVYDRIQFDYADFRDLRTRGLPAGQEPPYAFDANVLQFFVSFWF
jgi:hypothetical protein